MGRDIYIRITNRFISITGGIQLLTVSFLLINKIKFMSLSDTAEYWQDVKRNYPYCGPNYYHIPNFECGHRHLYEAKKLGDVNCKDCLKAINQGYNHNLPEGKTISRAEKKRLAAIKKQEELYGRCSCGQLRVLRINSKTKEKFLGCSNYPNCKITVSFF